MNIDLLLRLHAERAGSLSALRTRDAQLANAVEDIVDAHLDRAINERLHRAPPALVQAVRERVRPARGTKRRSLAELRTQPALAMHVKARKQALSALEQVAARTAPELALTDNAALRGIVARARIAGLATRAGLDASAAQRVTDGFAKIAAIDHEGLEELVASRALSGEQAQRLGNAITIANVVDHDELAAALLTERVSARDLARLTPAQWRERLTRARLTAPAGLTVESWANALASRAAVVFPTGALLGQFPELATPLVANVHQRAPDLDLLALDYRDGGKSSGLDLSSLSAADRTSVLRTLQSYQRIYAVAGTVGIAASMLKAGYTSAAAVVMEGKHTLAAKTGLSAALIETVYSKAQQKVGDVSAALGTIVDAVSGGFGQLAVGNLSPSIKDYLKDLDGFSDLFGSQATCRCEHCQSILSPAAYFVDLMCFVQKHVTGNYFTGPKADHVLALPTRRPDLWKLELTCANTNDVIPTLDVINEVLENYIALDAGFNGQLADRAAVEELVYHQKLAVVQDSFKQPFHLPLARLDTYLAHFGESRFSIATTLDAPAAVATRGRLRVSPAEYALITQPNVSPVFLRRIYALAFAVDNGGNLAAFDAHSLLRPMGLDRNQLGELVTSRFITAATPVAIQIKAEKTSSESVQNDIERIRHLTWSALDRMHRFVRLQRSLGWTIGELDLVLDHLGASDIGPETLNRISALLVFKDTFGSALDEVCALSSVIPRVAQVASKPPLFDRLFNLPFFVQADGELPEDATRFVHPALRSGPPGPSSAKLARLLGGLRVSDEDLLRLISALEQPLGFDLDAANEDERGFFLTAHNLSLLYRHARLAAYSKLDVVDLFRLLAHAGLTHVANESDLRAFVEHSAWWKASRYKLDDIAIATGGGPRDPKLAVDPVALAAKIVSDVKAARALGFADTLFAFFEGVTEEQSLAIIKANPTAIIPAPGTTGWWISADFGPSGDLVIPPGVPLAPADAKQHLLRHHASEIIPVRIVAELGIALPRLNEMLAMAGVDPADPAFARVLQEIDPPDALATAIQLLVPLRALFQRNVWDAPALAFVRSRPDVFAIASFTAIPMNVVRKLATYATFADSAASFTDTAAPLDPGDVRDVLAAFTSGQGFAAADPQQLAAVMRAEPGLVATMTAHLALPTTAPEAMAKLALAIGLAQRLGVSAETLTGAISDDYSEIAKAAAAVLAAFRSRYSDEASWLEQLEPFDDQIRQRKRDALVDHLLYSLHPDLFEDENDLYHYFLIDVELCGCARTSRVVAAISSVQLYVHRVVLNLEQDRRPPNDPKHVAIPADAIPTQEWVWRKNYRVWEANRKVFLWPENYIEPELRDDKSPQFEDLESALNQQEITDQTVLDAYARYLAGFDEVAKLKIAGVYHDIKVDSGEDVLHVFGVAPGDPPIYYYRTGHNVKDSPRGDNGTEQWTPWRKLDAQIPATRVGVTVYKSRLYLFWTEHRARSMNKVVHGSSQFGGYRHTMKLRMTTLRLDGTWSPAQDIALPGDDDGFPFGPSAGEILDPFWPPEDADQQVPLYEFPDRAHDEPRDDYMLSGPNWESVYLDAHDEEFPGMLNIVARNYTLYAYVDLFRRRVAAAHTPRDLDGVELDGRPILCSREEKRADDNGSLRDARILYFGHPVYWYPNRNSYADLVLDDRRIARFNDAYHTEPLHEGLYKHRLLDGKGGVDLNLVSVAGAIDDAVIQHDSDVFYLQRVAGQTVKYRLSRIGTTLSEKLNEKLFADGIEGVLSTKYQLGLAEAPMPVKQLSWRVTSTVKTKPLGYSGPMGVYYREIFFHIPFLIANALNAQGNYQAAQRWYHSIFDPTAAEVTSPPTDRNWRYAEFRGLDVTSLRDILEDTAAIEVYKNDPFNPHAIARLRISAYQKCVVMKYIDNLLDWGDSLFSQFTMESVGEATLLYVMAADILGERPVELGECGDTFSPRTYETLEPFCNHGSELLLELETQSLGNRFAVGPATLAPNQAAWVIDTAAVSKKLATYAPSYAMTMNASAMSATEAKASTFAVLGKSIAARMPADGDTTSGLFRGPSWSATRIGSWKSTTTKESSDKAAVRLYEHAATLLKDKARLSSFGLSLVTQINPAFCIPPNKDLRAYWDRVEDRLFKIRNCMDIAGVRRELSLFSPEIDPRMLVRMKAAGLSLDDVLGALSGNLPPYRFQFLIERAKHAAASLQGYGAALLSALEKKDGEELGRLRTLHQQHLLQLTTKLRRWEIDTCESAIEALEKQREAVEFRRDYYKNLVDGGLSPAERLQTRARLEATLHTIGAAVMDIVSSVLHLIPQVGSPFSMKFGGLELGTSAKSWSDFVRLMGGVWESVSGSAGLIGSWERRSEGWEYQHDVAEQELKPILKQLEAARIRRDMAERSLQIHEKTIEQTEEVFDFLKDKVTNQALYTFLATSLQRLYRDAYQGAFALARLAEQAFRFERSSDQAPMLEPSYWDSTRAGFLAGEKLLIDLNNLDRHFIETNYRTLEIDQPFSITQLDPRALVQLRETGSCEIAIPEVFFDLFYPGHYDRRIKHVKLTIPCVTGPYTNVSATLSVVASQLRPKPTLGPTGLVDVPPRRSVSIATSTGQSDAGVFELSFRDERYMPFEGLGAISKWRISLPKSFRPFDYQTINDVILTISYTARDDQKFRETIELQNANTEGTILNTLSSQPLGRLFSLRQDFSSAFHRLLHAAPGVPVPIEITDKYFPLFLKGRTLSVTKAALALRTAAGQNVGAFALQLDGANQAGFAPSVPMGNLFARDLGPVFSAGIVGTHTFAITAPGGLAPEDPPPVPTAIDPGKLEDVLLYVEYTVATP